MISFQCAAMLKAAHLILLSLITSVTSQEDYTQVKITYNYYYTSLQTT